MSELWHIQLLGSFQITGQDRTITRFETHKTRSLLAYLAYYGGMHAREQLTEAFWPDVSPERARNNLSVALSSLRSQLEPPGIPATAVVVADRHSVGLRAGAVTTDASRFEALLEAAQRSPDPIERRQRLQQAIVLYRDPFLSGFYEPWVIGPQERLVELYFGGIETLLDLLNRPEDVDAALHYCRCALRLDPFREELHEYMIRRLAGAGRYEASRRQFDDLSRILQAEMGVRPSTALRNLAHELSEQAPVQATVSKPSPSLVSFPFLSPGSYSTLTFLLVDIGPNCNDESALSLKEDNPAAWIDEIITQHGGRRLSREADQYWAAFPSVGGALAGVASLWAWAGVLTESGLPLRAALDTADAELTQDLACPPPIRSLLEQILTVAEKGQAMLSAATGALARAHAIRSGLWLDLNIFRESKIDLPNPENALCVYGANVIGQVSDSDAPHSVPSDRPDGVPIWVTRFFGRETETDSLLRLLRQPARLITITGAGGSGKTRFVAEAITRLRGRLPAAISFVSLADLVEAERLPETILHALHLVLSGNSDPMIQALEALQKQPRLLVLDCFERLVDGGAGIVERLMAGVPTLVCIVTSRRLLGLVGEQELALRPLLVPDPTLDRERLVQYASVQLFIDRAQQVRSDFQLTRANARAVADLCCQLDGIPLALELAATRTPVQTPQQMLAQLQDRFAFLVSRKRDTPARHRTLWAAIEWSYQELTPETQRFFANLSVFVGGWTAEAAEEICLPVLDALDQLTKLRECSLVVAEEQGTEIRFRLLDTIREFGQKQLSAEEQYLLEQRHAAYHLSLAEKGHENTTYVTEYLAFREACFRTEWENYRAAFRWFRAHPDADVLLPSGVKASGAHAGVHLVSRLTRYMEVSRDRWECREMLDWAISRSEDIPPALLALIYIDATTMSEMFGDHERAAVLNAQAIRCAREVRDARSLILAVRAQNLTGSGGDSVRAHALLEEAAGWAREAGQSNILAFALTGRGHVALNNGELDAARNFYQESLETGRGERLFAPAEALMHLSRIAAMQGDYSAAWRYAEDLKKLEPIEGDVLLGELHLEVGDYTSAQAYLGNALTAFEAMENRKMAAWMLRSLGVAAFRQGDVAQAKADYRASLTMYVTLNGNLGIARLKVLLAEVALLEGDLTEVRRLGEDGLAGACLTGRKECQVQALDVLCRAALAAQDFSAARQRLAQCLPLLPTVLEWEKRIGVLECASLLARAEGSLVQAVRLLAMAEALREAHTVRRPPIYSGGRDALHCALQEMLGTFAFNEAWESGRTGSWQQALEEMDRLG